MSDYMSNADTATAYDPGFKHPDASRHTTSPGKGKSTMEVVATDLSSNDAQKITERPFFVVIGKGGLLAAIQELDTQLQQVCV